MNPKNIDARMRSICLHQKCIKYCFKNLIEINKFKKSLKWVHVNSQVTLDPSPSSVVSASTISFLRTHNLISHDQFGFLARRSTFTKLLASVKNWTLSFNNGVKVDVMIAFDSVFIA